MPDTQVSHKPASKIGRYLLYVAGPLLVAYLLLLLGTTYIAQQDLREASHNELTLNSEKRAAALSYFFSERVADLTNLTEDPSISVYFSNRALGMSMEYGLRASLLFMQRRFLELVKRKTIDSSPVYQRLLFIDTENKQLVDVGIRSSQPEHWNSDWIRSLKSNQYKIVLDNDDFHMMLLMPYFYKEEKVGTILAEINHVALFEKLVQQQSTDTPPYVFLSSDSAVLDFDRKELASNNSNRWSYPKTVSKNFSAYTKVSIIGTPFILAAQHPTQPTEDFLQSPLYLVSLALIALLVLITAVVGIRIQSHNLVLKVQYEESKRQGKVLHKQNQLLEQEIQKRHEYENKLAHQANYDSLTELPNRTLAMDRLTQALALAKRQHQHVVGMFIDLDRFKNVNDTLGHDAGDLLLKHAAHRLQTAIRATDTAARLGGDEFMILMPDAQDINTAETVCEKIMESFSRPFSVHGQEFSISASIGVAIGPENGDDAKTLMKCADLALYRAKEAGRDTYRFYTQEMNQHAERRQAIETQLIRAMEKEEFYLNFQPMVSLSDNRIIGVEALIRWTNQALGAVSPGSFIPLAEESGLIVDIGDWVIRQSLETIAGLGPEASQMRLAVNVSCRQLLKPKHFYKLVETALSDNNFPAEQLEIEITERLLLDDRREVLVLLHELTELGVRLVVDDFGTGFSALSYLKKFPLSSIKVDQSFIRDVLIDNSDASLTKAIIAIAHELGMEAVGEGVEQKEQAAFLRHAGCDVAQGYLFGHPTDAETLWKIVTGATDQLTSIPNRG